MWLRAHYFYYSRLKLLSKSGVVTGASFLLLHLCSHSIEAQLKDFNFSLISEATVLFSLGRSCRRKSSLKAAYYHMGPEHRTQRFLRSPSDHLRRFEPWCQRVDRTPGKGGHWTTPLDYNPLALKAVKALASRSELRTAFQFTFRDRAERLGGLLLATYVAYRFAIPVQPTTAIGEMLRFTSPVMELSTGSALTFRTALRGTYAHSVTKDPSALGIRSDPSKVRVPKTFM